MGAVQDSTRAVDVQDVTASAAAMLWQAYGCSCAVTVGLQLETPGLPHLCLQVEKEDAGRPIPVAVMKGAPEVIRQHLKHVGGTPHCNDAAAGSPAFRREGSPALGMPAMAAVVSDLPARNHALQAGCTQLTLARDTQQKRSLRIGWLS